MSSPTRFADVGAVIVTHASPAMALACVDSLAGDLDATAIVVVVNDPAASDPDAIALLQERVRDVVLNARPEGYGANVNAGFARLSAGLAYVLLLNDDVVAEHGAVATLREELEHDAHVGLAGPQLVDADGSPQPSFHRFPSLGSEIADAAMLPGAAQRFARRFNEPTAADVEHGDVWPVGAALLVRAAAFRALGGFDEGYFLYSEETDLARRLRDAGLGVRFCGDAVVRHLGAQSTGDRHQRLLGLSRWRYVRKNWSPFARVALLLALPLVFLWNAVYAAALALTAPRSLPDKLRWWHRRWVKRPLPDLRLSPASRPRRR
jgi:N-acetylglucosaminyl-diphospho-decaprenol L-rhamnosyltransferase